MMGRAKKDLEAQKRKHVSEESEDDDKQVAVKRGKKSKARPKFFLLPIDGLSHFYHNNSGHLSRAGGVRDREKLAQPLYPVDIQHLITFAMLSQRAPYKPRWCNILRIGKLAGVTVVVIPHVTNTLLEEHKDQLKYMNHLFSVRTELVPSSIYGGNLINELLTIPISKTHLNRHGTASDVNIVHLDTPKVSDRSAPRYDADAGGEAVNPWLSVSGCVRYPREIYPDHSAIHHPAHTSKDKVDRCRLVLSTEQMLVEGYPLPTVEMYSTYKATKTKYQPVTSTSPMFGLDCEMVRTTHDVAALARISLVNEDLECIYDSLVKPTGTVLDYMSQYSGVTKKILEPITVTLEEVQEELVRILPPHAILCGQSLNSDLNALKMFHPYNIDTSVIYRLSGHGRKTSLKALTKMFLGDHIQRGSSGHDSVEDAKASLQLVQLKLAEGLEFGDVRLEQVPRKFSNHTEQDVAHRRNFFSRTNLYKSFLASLQEHGIPSLIIDSEENWGGEQYHLHRLHVSRFMSASTNKQAVALFKQYEQHMQGQTPHVTPPATHVTPPATHVTPPATKTVQHQHLSEHSRLSLLHLWEPLPGEVEGVARHVKRLDKMVAEVCEVCQDMSLVVVVCAGSDQARTRTEAGVCMVRLVDKRGEAR